MTFTVSSVGDISFQGLNSDNPENDIFADVKAVFENSDIVIANLECPLLEKSDGSPVAGKCTLRGSTGWADVLKKSGINLVTLANNHMMDFGEAGLLSTIKELDRAGINHTGAGRNIEEACRPLVLKVAEKNIAVFARSSVIVASPSYAGKNTSGVAFLDVEETVKAIKKFKKTVDYIILIMHWGIEEYDYPSPEQRLLAEKFVEAGVDLLLGHHPHVVQGIEKINKGVVHYSSGNFVFDEFNWSFINRDGELQDTIAKMSRKNRQGMVLNVEFNDSHLKYDVIHTVIGSSGSVKIDKSYERVKIFNSLCQRLQWPAYKLWWPVYSAFREFDLRILPLVRGKFTWSKIKKIRPGHFKQLADTLKRSLKITSEKSTNPYD